VQIPRVFFECEPVVIPGHPVPFPPAARFQKTDTNSGFWKFQSGIADPDDASRPPVMFDYFELGILLSLFPPVRLFIRQIVDFLQRNEILLLFLNRFLLERNLLFQRRNFPIDRLRLLFQGQF
jgi:hypothetical protein